MKLRVRSKIEAAAALCLLTVLLFALFFLFNAVPSKRDTLRKLELEIKTQAEQENRISIFTEEARALDERTKPFSHPYADAKNAFDDLKSLLLSAELRYSQLRQKNETPEEVHFELSGMDAFPALLSFLNRLAVSGCPAKITAASFEGASGEMVNYTLTLAFLKESADR